jgi:plasmid stability protein
VDLLIRDVPQHVLDALRARAKEHGRSVQAVALDALQRGAEPIGRSLFEWLPTVANPDVDVEAGLKAIRDMRSER